MGRFETQAKDKAEAAEMVRPEDEKAGAETIAITQTEKDEIVLESEKVRTEANTELESLEAESGKIAKGKGKKGKKDKDKKTKASVDEEKARLDAEVKAITETKTRAQ